MSVRTLDRRDSWTETTEQAIRRLAAIAMFVAIPWVYPAALTVLAERWLAPGARFRSVSKRVVWLPLLPCSRILRGHGGAESAHRGEITVEPCPSG